MLLKGIPWLNPAYHAENALLSRGAGEAFWCFEEGAVSNCKEISISKIATELSQWLLCIYFWSQKYHCYFLLWVCKWDVDRIKFWPLRRQSYAYTIEVFSFHPLFPLYLIKSSKLILIPFCVMFPFLFAFSLMNILLDCIHLHPCSMLWFVSPNGTFFSF